MNKIVPPLLIAIALLSTGCTKQIARVNMISFRNIDSSEKYKKLASNKTAKGKTLEGAIDNAVKQVDGGVYMMDVKIYEKHNWFILFSTRKFKIEGNVWGTGIGEPQQNITKPQFSAGDEVFWTFLFFRRNGTISKVIDGNPVKAQIMVDGSNRIKKLKTDRLTKIASIHTSKINNSSETKTASEKPATQNNSIKKSADDFMIGDKVVWIGNRRQLITGIITGKDGGFAIVEYIRGLSKKTDRIPYSDLTKVTRLDSQQK